MWKEGAEQDGAKARKKAWARVGGRCSALCILSGRPKSKHEDMVEPVDAVTALPQGWSKREPWRLYSIPSLAVMVVDLGSRS